MPNCAAASAPRKRTMGTKTKANHEYENESEEEATRESEPKSEPGAALGRREDEPDGAPAAQRMKSKSEGPPLAAR